MSYKLDLKKSEKPYLDVCIKQIPFKYTCCSLKAVKNVFNEDFIKLPIIP